MENRTILHSSRQFFQEMVEKGFAKRKIKAHPHVQIYLVQILEYYLDARNLFEEKDDESGQRKLSTLAEMYLQAVQAHNLERQELLKKLGDQSLYISGFFGDSLARKVVDVDYYAKMGGAAYGSLAECAREDTVAQVYRTFSQRFLDFVDVLSYISQQSMVQTDQNILSLYDRYMRTGSESAMEKLVEMGVLAIPAAQAKLGRQD